MRNRTFYICVVSFLVIFMQGGLLFAQSAKQGDELPEYVFHVLLMDETDYGDSNKVQKGVNFKFATEDTVVRILAESHALTRAFSYKGLPNLVFFREASGADGEIDRKVLATTALGKPGMKVVLLRKKRDGKFMSAVLDIDGAKFSKNTIRATNFSNQSVRIKVNDKVETLGKYGTHDFKVSKRTGALVDLALAGHNGESPYLIDKRRYLIRDGDRKLILLYNKPRTPNEVTYSSFAMPAPTKVVNISDAEADEVDVSGEFQGGNYSQE